VDEIIKRPLTNSPTRHSPPHLYVLSICIFTFLVYELSLLFWQIIETR